MTLQPIPSEFPYISGISHFLFYQCRASFLTYLALSSATSKRSCLLKLHWKLWRLILASIREHIWRFGASGRFFNFCDARVLQLSLNGFIYFPFRKCFEVPVTIIYKDPVAMLMLSKTCEIDKKLAKDTHHENIYNNFLPANLSKSISDLFWPKLNITKSHQRKYDKYPQKFALIVTEFRKNCTIFRANPNHLWKPTWHCEAPRWHAQKTTMRKCRHL